MGAVFKELTLEWDGETYSVKPTMDLLNQIEQKVSLSNVAYRIANGDPPLTQLATIIAAFLRAGGCRKVTSEDVYLQIMQGDEAQVRAMAESLMMAAFPQLGKADAPATASKPAAKRKRKKSTGATSTT